MKQLVLIIIIIGSIVSCKNESQNKTGKSLTLRIPGEFESQNSIWLGYKTISTIEEDIDDTVTIKIIKALNPYIHLNLIVEHDSLFKEGKGFFEQMGLDTSNITIFYQSPTDNWFRDPGPVFGITPENKLGLADFKYTGYTNLPPDSIDEWAKADEGIDRNVAERLKIPFVTSIVAMEGGAFETNGKGTLIQVENITLKRNPHLSKKDIEEDFHDNFGIDNVIWLPAGLADDPQNFNRIQGNIFGFGTGGHTDEFVRFANDSTILLAWITEEEKETNPICKLNYDILSKNFEILKNSQTHNGYPFRIIKVPHAFQGTYKEVIDSSWVKNSYYREQMGKYSFKFNDTIIMAYSASYLNYIITDKVVVLPEYWNDTKPVKIKEKDQKVHLIFEDLYPDRSIVGIDPTFFNDKGGGMHCRYQAEPKIK